MNILDRLHNPLAKNTLKLSMSNVIMYLLPLIVTPILSRLYTQEQYGEWGVFSSTFLIINSILFLSYENTIVKSREDEVSGLCLACSMVACTVIMLTVCVFFAGRFIGAEFFCDFPSLGILVALLFVSLFNQLLYNLSNRYEQYMLMSVTNVVQGIGQAISRLALSFVKSINGLIVGNVIAQILSVLSYVYGLRKRLPAIFHKKPGLHEVRSLLVKYKNFPLYDAPGLVLESSIFNLALIILSLYFTKDIIGCYSIIFQFLVLPVSLVGSAMSKVYYREISVTNSTQEISSITKKVSKMTYGLSLLPITFIALGGDKLITIFLGNKWAVAGNIALCMSIMSVPIILAESLLPLFRRLDKQRTRLSYDVLCFAFGLGGLLLSCNLSDNIYIVLVVYVICYSFARYFLFFNILRNAKADFPVKTIVLASLVVLVLYIIAFVRINSLIHQ